LSDSQPEGGDVQKLREALRQPRGPGNFRNLFVHSPNGKKDRLQMIPVRAVATKEGFTGIESFTRGDKLAALLTSPQLLRIVPAEQRWLRLDPRGTLAWAATELAPLQIQMTAINEWLGQTAWVQLNWCARLGRSIHGPAVGTRRAVGERGLSAGRLETVSVPCVLSGATPVTLKSRSSTPKIRISNRMDLDNGRLREEWMFKEIDAYFLLPWNSDVVLSVGDSQFTKSR
jgi:hypothetical protein